MEFGLSRTGSYDDVLSDALWAEQHGLCAICISDHFLRAGADDPSRAPELPSSDPFVHLAGLARETTTIALGVMVASVTFRHPAVVLKSAIDLDIMSGGRFVLGLGAGYRESEHEIFGIPFPSLGERYRLLEESLQYVRAGLTTPNPGFEGDIHRLKPHPIAPRPTGRVRIMVGGAGARRTPGIAGTYADEYNVFPMAPEEMRARIAVARAACEAAGRDPHDLVLSSGGPIITGETRAEYRDDLCRHAHHARIEANELERDHRANRRLIGTYDEVSERLAELAELGISRFYIRFEGDGLLDRERLLSALDAVAPG